MDLLSALAPYTGVSSDIFAIFIGVVARLTGLVFFLPGLGERSIPVRVRLAATLAIALVLTPIVLAAEPTPPVTPGALAATLTAELIAGGVIGFSIRIAIYAIQIAGSIAAQGMSLSQLFSGLEDTPEPPVGIFFMFAGIALAASVGLHFDAVRAIAVSYEVMPFGQFPGAGDAGEWAASRVAFAFSAALALSLPFVVMGFIYNLAIGAANRAMPQLMVAFVGAPAVSLAGLAMLALSVPVIFSVWRDMLDAIMATLLGAGS